MSDKPSKEATELVRRQHSLHAFSSYSVQDDYLAAAIDDFAAKAVAAHRERIERLEKALEREAAREWRDALLRAWPDCKPTPQNIDLAGFKFTAVVDGDQVVATMVRE